MCQAHWDKLRAAIDARGLSHLVAKGAEQAAERFLSAATEGTTASNYDPLMSANMMLIAASVQRSGPAILATNDDGSQNCPVCCKCGAKECPGELTGWIEGAANDAFEEAKQLGLVAT